ncbi:MAG: hypothetical protein ACI9UK_002142 [Candidatus Krumholzibacteriia bacterium]|jgi:hypothetical protein
MLKRILLILTAFIAMQNVATTSLLAQDTETKNLAAAAQNPLASMISLPFQNNTTFGGTEFDALNVFNIQPVMPFKLGDSWNLITRTVLPIISSPFGPDGQESGVGNTLFTGWFSPTKSIGKWTLGAGPAINIPTASKDLFGSSQWGGGPSVVGVFMSGKWVAGGLVNNVWGFSDTKKINSFLFQYFVNYNLSNGWYLVSAPIITADWNGIDDNNWVVPFGGGFGKLMKLGKQPINFNAQYYVNVERPDSFGESTVRVQLQFMFPK